MDATRGAVLILTDMISLPAYENRLLNKRFLPIDLVSASNWKEDKIATFKRVLDNTLERKPVALLMNLNYIQNETNPLTSGETNEIFTLLRQRDGKLALVTDTFTDETETRLRELWRDRNSVLTMNEPIRDIGKAMEKFLLSPGMGEAGPGTTAK